MTADLDPEAADVESLEADLTDGLPSTEEPPP